MLLIGDSLTRHHMAALSMLMRSELRFGGLVRTGINPDLLQEYGCDGQFSEAAAIRHHTQRSITSDLWFKEGLCSSIPRMHTNIVYSECWDSSCSPPFQSLCCNSTEPIFIQLSQGIHFGTDAGAVIRTFLTPVLAKLKAVITNCQYDMSTRIRILFVGLTPTDSNVEKKYPAQHRDRMMKFNSDISVYLHNSNTG